MKTTKNITTADLQIKSQNRFGIWSENECYKKIAKWYDRKFMVSLNDLNDLIDIYLSLGGKSHDHIDRLTPSEQFQLMWEFSNEKFLQRYKKIIDEDIL